MIVVDVKQGSPEWLEARMGIPTASAFHRILTPKTRKLAAGARTYMMELLAEWLLDTPLGADLESGFVQRGSEMEASAVRYYEFQRDVDTTQVGFVLLDESRTVGCSPDRLVGDDGGLEIKCPGPAQHVANMLEMSTQYRMQSQGGMWVCGRQWWDILSYHPELPAKIVRLERDDELIAALAAAVAGFVEKLRGYQEQLREHRIVRTVAAPTEAEVDYSFSSAEVAVTQPGPPPTGDEIPF